MSLQAPPPFLGPVPTGSGLDPYDGILLLSFGGPEAPEDVLPFLENVTRGRGVPRERLAEVARHYLDRGGRSPINDHNRRLLDALRAELDSRGLSLPLYWGNRNWHPLLPAALRGAHSSGARRLLVVLTSAYSGYSGCRQYREDLAAALLELSADGIRLEVDKVRPYFNHPSVAAAVTGAVAEAVAGVPPGTRLVFVTHSLPEMTARTSGPDGGAYLAQHRDLAATVAAGLGDGPVQDRDLVFCSRSGPPEQPWLGPDIEDHLRDLAAAGVPGVVVVPLGFVSDHMEVVHDLDVAAAATARGLGLGFVRAATPGTSPAFVAGLVDLALERAAQARGESVPSPTVGRLGPVPAVCPAGCCPNPRGPRPAACGADGAAVKTARPVRSRPDERPGRCAVQEQTHPARGHTPSGDPDAARVLPPGAPVEELMALAERAARLAGALVRDERPDRWEIATKSSPTDVVTQMDHAAEALLRQVLLGERPQDGLLGEESGLHSGTSGLTWVVDPIDGTVNYLYGLPGYAVSVALVAGDPLRPGQWWPLAGCVHGPASGATWTAAAGAGSFAGGRRLRMAAPPELARALIGTGFGYRAARRRSQARVLAALLPRIRDVRRIGSAAMDLCMVADGRLDAYYERGLHPWDLAAGTLVVREAGGQVRGLGGAPPSDHFVVAGQPTLVDALEAELIALDADRDDPAEGEPEPEL